MLASDADDRAFRADGKGTKEVSHGKDHRKLSNSEIASKVALKAKEATGWYDSRLSKERLRTLEYFNGTLPRKQHIGSSSYVSTDVYDAVQMMKAQVLEVFAGGDEIAQFDSDQDMHVGDCKAATAYCRYVIFRQNEGFRLFSNIIQDGLLARAGVAKVYWDERSTNVDEEFSNKTHQEAMALAAQPDVEEFEAEEDAETGLFKGSLLRKIDRSQVCIDSVAPEEFLIEPRAITLENAGYVAHRCLKTKDELKRMGFDPILVDRVHYDDARGLDLSPEVLARNAPVETIQALQNPIQPEVEKIMLYEEYVRMEIDSQKGVRLYKIMRADATIFDVQEVEKTPFIVFIPLPSPHIFYGENFAARVIPYQNARTILIRSVLDHASITTNPRWAVVKGGLLNPREMIDNRLGGLVNVARPDSVAALQVPNLNPFIFELTKMLQENKEQSTGISSLSQGLNKDAISKQNSAGLVDNLVQLSSQRQKIISRHFAYDFFVPLMLEVMRLVVSHEKGPKVVEVAGAQIKIFPDQWKTRVTCTVSMHLGYGDKEQHLQHLTTIYQALAQDPVLQGGFQYPQRYLMAYDAAKIAGVNIAAYLIDPGKMQQQPQAPQGDPANMLKAQAAMKTADAAMLTAQDKAQTNQRLGMLDAGKLQVAQEQVQVDALDKAQTHIRQNFETSHKVLLDHASHNLDQDQLDLDREMRPKEAAAKAATMKKPNG